jgi:2',3'-cyclic-nucleotide 2'-phosphodiesterase (5'-nucleotidase family)
MKKKVFACLLAAVMLLGMIVLPAAAKAEGEEAKEIVILYTNDVHAGVDQNIGYVGLVRIKAALEAAGKEVLLVDCGDSVQGELVATVSRGETNIELMNAVGYDVATIGNHEFDYGMEQFNKNVDAAKFQYVCCNFLDKDGKQVLAPYTIVEAAGKKIAFVGIDTPEAIVKSVPSYFQDAEGKQIFSFCADTTGKELYDKVQETVDAARAENVDYVIALAHLGIDYISSPWMSTDVIENTTGIDVMLDGHSHSTIKGEAVKNKDGEPILLSSTGTKLENVGMLTIDTQAAEDEDPFSTTLISANSMPFLNAANLMADDKGIGEVVKNALAASEELKNKVVAHTDVDLITHDPVSGERIIRSQETNLGDLVSDAYRIIGNADIGLINGGGIRVSIPAGDITFGKMMEVHPFKNEFCVVEATGQQVLDALELSVSALPGELGGFLHVSGLKYTIDMNVESSVIRDDDKRFVEVSGERRVKDVQVLQADGTYAPLDPEKTYTVAGINYFLDDEGDGYTMFYKKCTILQVGALLDHEVVINYIVDVLGGNVGSQYREPYGEDRVTFIQKGE